MGHTPKELLTRNAFAEGTVLLFDKPYGWTSFDVVGKVRGLIRHRLGLKKTKVGHAGTLDPLATGLLIVCTGKLTKTIDSYQALEKEYSGTFFIGQTTPSYDLETKPGETQPTAHITHNMVMQATNNFIGSFEQMPPQFSAKKIEGERAYTFARKGQTSVLKPKNVCISKFSITKFELPEIGFNVICSKGTYIRALARDFGDSLQTGAYLKDLRRERIGNFLVDNAWELKNFEAFIRELQGKPDII
jgi:tRNA pseudouridine55 synthase